MDKFGAVGELGSGRGWGWGLGGARGAWGVISSGAHKILNYFNLILGDHELGQRIRGGGEEVRHAR